MTSILDILPYFVTSWILLTIAVAVFFLVNKDPVLKRRAWKPIVLVVCGVLAGFLVLMGFYISSVVVAIIGFVNLDKVRICSACGTMHMPGSLFSAPAKFCSKCGSQLD